MPCGTCVRYEYPCEYASTKRTSTISNGDVSQELAAEEAPDAPQPWTQHAADQPLGSASMDQENVNPFSPAFKAQLASGLVARPETLAEEMSGDISMDVTRAVGGIVPVQVPG